MNSPRLVKVSKYLSKHLRHQPDHLGLKLTPGGWVSVDKLLKASAKHKLKISRIELQEVVENNDKKRFSFDSTGKLIRANQGHTVEVDLQLEAIVPPHILYHGTNHHVIDSIIAQGLSKMSRHHVHLSKDIATAKKVGKRRGRPVIFRIDAANMYQDGYQFYCSDNGVWLVDHVPADYLYMEKN
ncbi:MAG: RNA 2'-phosphotransferase [Moorea sp. SIO2B7]|nr:RNA 2'-phosphotransferase [Moorena sp. SIO2B7]